MHTNGKKDTRTPSPTEKKPTVRIQKNYTEKSRGNYTEITFNKGKNDHFDIFSEILNYLLKLRLPENGEDEKNVFWSFRGQRKSVWSLAIAPHLEITPHKNGIPNDNVNYDDWFIQYKKRMIDKRELDYLKDKDAWSWLFYAKHHDLHTRLLDWSSNPLVAMYFAVENILSRAKDNLTGAVWALKVPREYFRMAEGVRKNNPDPLNVKDMNGKPLSDRDWFMINPEPVTSRITLQSSKFTYHPGNNPTAKSVKKRVKPRPIDELPRRPGEELIKIIIPQGCNEYIRERLGIMNIHHASLFPSPTGIAYFVNAEWPEIAKY